MLRWSLLAKLAALCTINSEEESERVEIYLFFAELQICFRNYTKSWVQSRK